MNRVRHAGRFGVSETHVSRSSCPVEEASGVPRLEMHAPIAEQLLLHLDVPGLYSGTGAPPLTAAIENLKQSNSSFRRQELVALNSEVSHLRTLANRQTERIRHLEQALDQSLGSFKEARLQLINQQFLEEQLAATESIANIQQQAIVQLQSQIIRQQAELDIHLTHHVEQDPSLQVVLTTMECLVQTQQGELDRLRKQMVRDREDLQAYQQQLEQQLADAHAMIQRQQDHIAELEAWLSANEIDTEPISQPDQSAHPQFQTLVCQFQDQQTALDQLETELRQAHSELQEQQRLIEHLQRSQAVSLTSGSGVPTDLKTAHFRIEELESLSRHQQARIAELEQQTAEMQEQILQQAQQASEYETAIQHWKDRWVSRQDDWLGMKRLLEQALPEMPVEFLELLTRLTAEAGDETLPSHHLAPLGIHSRLDLPDFLIRRTRHKRTPPQT